LAVLLAAALVGGVIADLLDSDSGSKTTTTAETACPASKVAASTLPAVVTISVQGAGGSGSGSGEVIRPSGEILTNNHVISSAANGGPIDVVFDDGTTEPATLVGRDPQTDLAVVRVEPPKTIHVIPIGASSKLVVGQPVVALGAPLGLSGTVTAGIVSALERSVQVPADGNQTALLVGAVQTDASINPGNSGGSLVDCAGRLVGIPTAGAVVPSPTGAASGGSIGIGFAIPSELAKTIANELIAHRSVTHASFGVQVATVPSGSARGPGVGLYVVDVTRAGPAAAAGIRPGDILTKVDDKSLSSAEQLQGVTLTRRPGQTVEVVYRRDGSEHTATVTLGTQGS
jgi:putative serine protease PepD